MRILVDAPTPARFDNMLGELGSQVELARTAEPAMPIAPEVLREVEVLYTYAANFDPADAPLLSWVQLNTAGIDHLAQRPIMGSRIPVATATGAYSPAVAEYAMGLLLALTRRIPRGCKFQAQHCWLGEFQPWIGYELCGKTMAILGYGSIGRQIARIAQAVGMKILACKRHPDVRADNSFVLPDSGDPRGDIPAAWYGFDQVPEMFRLSDAVVICLPLTAETKGMVGRKQLKALPPHAYVVNVGRGGIVDEGVLVEMLSASELAGAAFDVFAEQPLPPESPLWDTPNMLIMPYIGSVTTHQEEHAAQVFLENLRRHLCGETLLNLVDKKLMY